MTWCKLGAEFDDECAAAGLSDAAYRTHVEAIGFLYRVERYDCRIPKHLIRRFAGSTAYDIAIKELVKIGYWREEDEAYFVMHHRDVVRQSLVAQQAKRSRDRTAQAKKRARQSQKDVSADVSAATDRQTDKQPATEQGGVDWPEAKQVPA